VTGVPDVEAPALVVLRGSSASGKTTLAGDLQRVLGPGVANIGQDHLRRVVLREHDVPGGDNIGLIAHTVEYCLGTGYDVVLEGIMLEAHYGEMLRELLGTHPGPSHVFYLDVPLDETLRRHEGRPLRSEVPRPPRPRDAARFL
jgi:adenylate kinase family enzyme